MSTAHFANSETGPADFTWGDAVFFLLIFLCFMLPGLVGREPWKADEAYTFGLVKHMVDTGDWLVPTLAGEPFMEKPPLFFISAAAFVHMAGAWLDMIDAARLACVFWVLLAAGAMVRVCRQVGASAESAVVCLVGASGMIMVSHYLMTDNALLAGFALALSGLLGAVQGRWRDAFFLGLGTGLAFLAKGLLGPGILGITACLWPLVDARARSGVYIWFLLRALMVALPFFVIWPTLLYMRSPVLFDLWFWDNNFGRFSGRAGLGPQKPAGGYFGMLLTVAQPAVLLFIPNALRRQVWRSPHWRGVALLFVTIFVVLSAASEGRSLYALPMLVPLAVMAAWPKVKPKSPWGQRCAILILATFVLLSGFVFAAFLYLHGLTSAAWRGPLARLFSAASGSEAARAIALSWPTFGSALLLCGVLFFWGWRQRHHVQAPTRAWAAGLAAFWASTMLLLLPWLAAGNDYRALFTELTQKIRRSEACVVSYNLGESQRALLDYYGALRTVRLEVRPKAYLDCPLFLYQYGRRRVRPQAPPGYEQVWEGARPGDTTELFILWRKKPQPYAEGVAKK